MSDLTASGCGCNDRVGYNNGCSGILWIIILLACCNGNSGCGGVGGILGSNGCSGG